MTADKMKLDQMKQDKMRCDKNSLIYFTDLQSWRSGVAAAEGQKVHVNWGEKVLINKL